MSANNTASFTGRIALAPTVHKGETNGQPDDKKTVVNALLITVTDVYKNRKTDEWVEKTSAIPVTFFYPASLRAQKMKTGQLWNVRGPMISSQYEDKSGNKRYALNCEVRSPNDLSLSHDPHAKTSKNAG